MTSFSVEPFDRRSHDRSDFECGVPALDRYLKRQLGQDVRRRVAAAYVLVTGDDRIVRGYYTLSASGLPRELFAPEVAAKLPPYEEIPLARIGRLAVDRRLHGQGVGGALLSDAVRRAISSGIGLAGVLVDAKDDAAVSFYEHFGFRSLRTRRRTLVLAIDSSLEKRLAD